LTKRTAKVITGKGVVVHGSRCRRDGFAGRTHHIHPGSPRRPSHVAAFERALKQANVESTVTVYPDQPHAFIETVDTIKAGGVQGQAWAQMLRFLEGALAARPATSGSGSPQAASDRIGWSYALRLGISHLMGHASRQ
jgi:acetyl esterase/lipase